jgi:hypothetical protein
MIQTQSKILQYKSFDFALKYCKQTKIENTFLANNFQIKNILHTEAYCHAAI